MKGKLPTLAFRLALRAFAYTLLTLAFIGVVVWLAAARVLADRATTSAEDYLLTLTSELEIATQPTDPNVLAVIDSAGEDRVGQIVDPETGTILVGTTGLADPIVRLEADSSLPTYEVEIDHPGRPEVRLFVKATTVSVGGEDYIVIAGATTGSAIFGSLASTAGVAAAAIAIAIGLGLGVWLSVRSALRPVERLADEADTAASAPGWQTWTLSTEATTAEIERLLDHLNSLLASVQESQAHERAFLEDASHDLRTPIAVARAELDLAMSTTEELKTREALLSAIEELDRLDRLAADLLILARMRAAPTHPPQEIHLGQLVRKAAARMMRDPHRPRVRVTVEGDADVLGDPITIERAVENVLSNAIRHANKAVEIELERSSASGLVRFSDDGPGFPASLLGSATERFARGSSQNEGTGLGLAIASAIAEAHGGSLQFRNRELGGAQVTLEIPSSRAATTTLHPVIERKT